MFIVHAFSLFEHFSRCKFNARRALTSIAVAMAAQIIRQPSTIFLTSRKWGIPDNFLVIPCIKALSSLNSSSIVKSPQ